MRGVLPKPFEGEGKMWEKAKFIGLLAISFSLLCLAGSIFFFGYELSGWRKELPDMLSTLEETSGQIAPALENVSEIEELIPPILEEVAAVRKTVDGLVAEVQSTREALPELLADLELITRQIENTTGQLPAVIDPLVEEVGKSREVIPDILKEIENTNATIGNAVAEIQLTREAIPGIMDRADQIVAHAGEVGVNAGKGAVTGMLGGLITAPFGVVGGIGKGVSGLFSSEVADAATPEDLEIVRNKLLDIAENGNVGDVVTWENRKSSNKGKITLLKKFSVNDQECREVKIEADVKGKAVETTTLSGCKQPDGSWIVAQ